jgi:hypothetical protein
MSPGLVSVGHVPVLPGVRVPGLAQPVPRGNIGGLLPVISPSPAAFAPSQVRQLTFGRDDSVTMGPGPVARRSVTTVLLAIAAVIVIAATGGWLAVIGRGQRRRTR